MRKITLMLVALCLLTFTWASAQSKMACYVKLKSVAAETPTATARFAMLSNEAAFRETHENPLPFTLQDKAGKMIFYKTPDDKTATAYEIRASKKTDKYLFVIHEWWG